MYYLSSFPGLPNRSSTTTVQALANGLINGDDISRWMIEELGFKNFLGLDFPDWNRFDFDQWESVFPSAEDRTRQNTTSSKIAD
ncbi:MAG: hypothetical protein Q9210_000581 [Variospora velana]